jgi:hypothetical protein
MSRRFQFSLGDALLGTAVVAAIVATIASREAIIGFVAFSVLLVFVWQRPVLFRFWLIAALGIGSGLLTAMFFHATGNYSYLSNLRMTTDELAGWGTGMLVGGLVAWLLLLSNPP